MVIPLATSTAVLEFCETLSPGHQAVKIPITPVDGSYELQCFPNVIHYIQEHGGKLLCGWALWEWPRVFLEGEFHGVWVSPEGQFVDITPSDQGAKFRLFLPDPTKEFDGRQVDNVRIPLTSNPRARDLIELLTRKFAIYNKGDRASATSIILEPEERRELRRIEMRFAQLGSELTTPPSRNDACKCGSGKKYKKCCGS